jgi:hypothetical protein
MLEDPCKLYLAAIAADVGGMRRLSIRGAQRAASVGLLR